jgi:hypothetical protein
MKLCQQKIKKMEESRYIFKYACYVPLGRSAKETQREIFNSSQTLISLKLEFKKEEKKKKICSGLVNTMTLA